MSTRQRERDELVDLDCTIVGETTKAYRVDLGNKLEWLPKSQCQWDKDAKKMTMPRWLATDKGLV